MNKTIEQFSDLELKAMKADIYEQNQVNLQNLQIINQELKRRSEVKVVDKPIEDETKTDTEN